MTIFRCAKCGCSTDICYTDSGVLGMVHGQCMCRSCYMIEYGNYECPGCRKLMNPRWSFCPWCGQSVSPTTARMVDSDAG